MDEIYSILCPYCRRWFDIGFKGEKKAIWQLNRWVFYVNQETILHHCPTCNATVDENKATQSRSATDAVKGIARITRQEPQSPKDAVEVLNNVKKVIQATLQ